MLLSGKQTTNVKVDVSPSEIIEAVEELFKSKYKIYDGYSHIAKDGYWYLYDGENYHNGDIEWKQGNKATEEEIAFDWEYKTFLKVLKSLKQQ